MSRYRELSRQLTDRIESVVGMVDRLRRVVDRESGVAETKAGT